MTLEVTGLKGCGLGTWLWKKWANEIDNVERMLEEGYKGLRMVSLMTKKGLQRLEDKDKGWRVATLITWSRSTKKDVVDCDEANASKLVNFSYTR